MQCKFLFQITLVPDNCADKHSNTHYTYYTFVIRIKKPALFIYLELDHPDIEKYKFSDNGFVLTEPIKIVHVEIELKNESCLELTNEHVRDLTVNQLFVYSGSGSNYSTTESNNGEDESSTTTSATASTTTTPKEDNSTTTAETTSMTDSSEEDTTETVTYATELSY